VRVDDDVSLNAPRSGITDRLTYGGGVRLGYTLAGLFGGTGPTGTNPFTSLPWPLMTPYVNVGEVKRHGQPALISGAGFEAWVTDNWTANADYLRYNYNQGGSAALAIQKDENEFRFTLSRHFNFGR